MWCSLTWEVFSLVCWLRVAVWTREVSVSSGLLSSRSLRPDIVATLLWATAAMYSIRLPGLPNEMPADSPNSLGREMDGDFIGADEVWGENCTDIPGCKHSVLMSLFLLKEVAQKTESRRWRCKPFPHPVLRRPPIFAKPSALPNDINLSKVKANCCSV
jgi:hypothetical protein